MTGFAREEKGGFAFTPTMWGEGPLFSVRFFPTPQQILVLLVANALASGWRGCQLVCDYSWARCSMVAVTR